MYCKEELIKLLQDKAEELGRTPKRREMNKPDSKVYTSRFGSWNNALDAAGLQILRKRGYTTEEYKQIILKWHNENNKMPEKKDFNEDIYLPDVRTIERKFNKTWLEIMQSLGIGRSKKLSIMPSEITESDAFELFKEEYVRINPSGWIEFDKNSTYTSSNYISRCNCKTWNELLTKCNFKLNHVNEYGEDRLAKDLKDICNKLGYIPSSIEVQQLGYPLHAVFYLGYTYNSFLKKHKLDQPNKTPDIIKETDKELMEMYRQFSIKIGKDTIGASSKDLDRSDEIYNTTVFETRFGSLIAVRELCGWKYDRSLGGATKQFTKRDLIEILLNEYKKYGRKPTNKEIDNNKDIPCVSSFLRYFKTTGMKKVWKEVLDE